MQMQLFSDIFLSNKHFLKK